MKLLLVLVPLTLLVTLIPWPGNSKPAHAASISCPPTIAEGSSGTAVRDLQGSLYLIDSTMFNLSLDGQFGPLTRAAVIAFQRAAFPNDPSQWDGIVGPHTWSELGQCQMFGGGVFGGGCTSTEGQTACVWASGGMVYISGSSDLRQPASWGLSSASYGGVESSSYGTSFYLNSSRYGYVAYEYGYNNGNNYLAVSPVLWP